MARILKLFAKTADGGSSELVFDKKRVWGNVEDRQCRNGFPMLNPQVDGEYLDLEIDIDTGLIVNWKIPTKASIEETLEDEE
jgi:hypothetical protein